MAIEKSHIVDIMDSPNISTSSDSINLINILYVLTLDQNLMSIRTFINIGYIIVFANKQYLILDNKIKNSNYGWKLRYF